MDPFAQRLSRRIRALDSRVCLGIDPRPEAHPLTHPERFDNDPAKTARAVVHYFQAVLDGCAGLVACVKPQTAFFERLGIPGLIALAQLIADARARELPVIVDGKRGDIGSTAAAYADAYLADGVFAGDALTVNPFLGLDTLEPFATAAAERGRGVFVLLKTSNPGSGDLQDLELASGEPLHQHLAARLTEMAGRFLDPDGLSPIGAVVGATHPEALARLRAALPHSLLLVPGYGAQGAGATEVAPAFFADGGGAVVNASRSLTYTTDGDDIASAARRAAEAMRDAINRALDARG